MNNKVSELSNVKFTGWVTCRMKRVYNWGNKRKMHIAGIDAMLVKSRKSVECLLGIRGKSSTAGRNCPL